MNLFSQKTVTTLANQAADGPWRAKSVLAALAVVVVGLGFWFSDIKNHAPQSETNSTAVKASGAAPSSIASAPAGSHWNWGNPFPLHVRLGLSYVAGYCIGWFFRKLTRLILVVVALVIALLAYGKLAGCDMTHMQEQVKRGGAWAQQETTTAENYLKHMLPSATAGGTGIFLGFRRRGQAATPKPAA